MWMLKLTKIEGKETMVMVGAVVLVEPCDDESTWVELVNGTKFLVREFAADIIRAMGAKTIEVSE